MLIKLILVSAYVQGWHICRYQPSWECLECGTTTSLVLKAMHFFLMTRYVCNPLYCGGRGLIQGSVLDAVDELNMHRITEPSMLERRIVIPIPSLHPGHVTLWG